MAAGLVERGTQAECFGGFFEGSRLSLSLILVSLKLKPLNLKLPTPFALSP